MLVQGIKSRPVYTGLTIDVNARRHLFALEGEGVVALREQIDTHGPEFLKTSDILCVGPLPDVQAEDMWSAPSIAVLLNRLRVNLINSNMGTRLYLSGTEGFIGQAMKVALEQGIDFNSIRTEHRGSKARRVQCVHCKGITEDVTTSPYACTHCGLNLLVRDHYSRRLAAFQGVCIDAEEPGTAPAPVEMFP
jgi:dimethylamine monooxygenase subunit C